MCLREFSLVDDTMDAIGSPKKYQRLHKWIIGITNGYIVYMFYQLAVYTLILKLFYQININFYAIFAIFSFFYREFVHVLCALIWGTILGLVYM